MQLAVLSLARILAVANVLVEDREQERSVMQRAILDGIVKLRHLQDQQGSVTRREHMTRRLHERGQISFARHRKNPQTVCPSVP